MSSAFITIEESTWDVFPDRLVVVLVDQKKSCTYIPEHRCEMEYSECGGLKLYKCSECGFENVSFRFPPLFCSNCGAKVKEEWIDYNSKGEINYD